MLFDKGRVHRLLVISLSMITAGGLSSCSNLPTAEPAAKTVTVQGQFSGEQQASFEQAMVPFEADTGIDVVYEATDTFTDLLEAPADTASPDLLIFPQPGTMAEFARAGRLVPLDNFMDATSLRAAYPDVWLDLGSVDEIPYGIWYRVSVKSLVWYRPTAFEAKGYDIPRTWSALIELSDRIVADGGTPWCIGLESGDATGWPGTDWIEDILLRTGGPEVYSQWISHRLPFNSPQVVRAFNEFGKFLRNPKYVKGGGERAITMPYGESVLGLFSDPPDCYLHRQANFVASFFPEDKEARIDYDVFLLPGIDPRFGTPLLVAGDSVAMLNDSMEARSLMKYIASPVPHEIGAKLGGFISPHKQVSLEAYPNVINQNIAQILADADVIRFDGSDRMPAAVGTGSFWAGIIDFAKGKSAEEVTKSIDDTWP